MSTTVKKSITFSSPPQSTYAAAVSCIKAMKGKVQVDKPDAMHLEAKMDKKLNGVVLGDYSLLEIDFSSESDESTTVSITGYPVNVMGQPMKFGARPGVVAKVITALQAEMEKALA